MARRTMTVTGRCKASADADLVVLRFGVTGRDPSYSTSVEELNRRVETLRADLDEAGVERERLKTTGFSVRPETRYDREREEEIFLAYVASHRMRLEIPFDKDVLNGVLTRVAQSAREAAVTVSFEVSDREALRRAAMRAAVGDAMESARVLADAAGASLGRSFGSTTATSKSAPTGAPTNWPNRCRPSLGPRPLPTFVRRRSMRKRASPWFGRSSDPDAPRGSEPPSEPSTDRREPNASRSPSTALRLVSSIGCEQVSIIREIDT